MGHGRVLLRCAGARGCVSGTRLATPDVEELGVARSSRTGRYYAVQDFGRPKSKEIKFSISNQTDATVKYSLDGKTYTLEPGYTIIYERCRPPKLSIPTEIEKQQ
jgi:hypothetical protein